MKNLCILTPFVFTLSTTVHAEDRPEGDFFERASQYDCRATGSNNLEMEEVQLIQDRSNFETGVRLYDYKISFTQLDDSGFNLSANYLNRIGGSRVWLSRNLQPGEYVHQTLCHEPTESHPSYCLFIRCTKR